ncbi:MAG: bacteriorhodopsin [Cyanobacteria bacterium J06626_14]
MLSWDIYPIAYLLPPFGIAGATATVGLQVGYTIADILAKPIFGLCIYAIARAKTADDQAEAVGDVVRKQPELKGALSN